MNGGGNGTGDDHDEDSDGSGEDSEGGFVFGPERHPVADDEPDERSERESEPTSTLDGEADPESKRRADDDTEREPQISINLPDEDESEGEDRESATDSPSADPEPADDDPSEGPGPSPNAVRNWSLLAFVLALSSFVTAGITYATHDDLAPVVGAATLGVVFAALAVTAPIDNITILETLSAGWLEHRRPVWFSIGLFAFGMGIGVVLVAAGVDLSVLFLELLEQQYPDLAEDGEIGTTASFYLENNSQAFFVTIAGALSVGLVTAFAMLFNGVVVGNVGAIMGSTIGVDYVVAGLTPHGIFELPALFIAAGVGFRLLYRFGERVFGKRAVFLTKPYVYRTVAFVVFGWLLLALAAFVEAYVTPELLGLLFPEIVEAAGA
ncbi:stage II sporulation protein M [Natronobacterium gregoryi]|uniref:Uncharacterized membrane protein n=3 Tax=cellular organisms TaxID=131567 RepID=L0AGD8_NATGS|nr:stage II sporulation protein M [Natronobacterium gregoryi]AFZ72983.1 uncharacterized membrane protein [Natronobacterium gregoryi SP2]ELY70086.1 hypothetical protein C490_06969 [Natronobacterium gregoryi SP2]PLK19068.1 hypothetical protein CYV19_16800 [Natronobacterium gregoryi SP2]SFJ62176.1 Uncharacterized membrane protein SpoIIM, required for sporulation [Natronobacterium gregoryi]